MSYQHSQIKSLEGCFIMDGHFELKKLLGAGAFGTVYLAERVARGKENDGEKFAVKVLSVPKGESVQKMQLVDELLLQMEAAGHKNVLRAKEVSHVTLKGEEFACIRMDLCEGGDMLDALKEGTFDEEKRARSAFLQVIDGVMHSHKNGVFHRDLKYENVLCTTEGKELCLKIADFGLATKHTVVPYGYYAGTPRYMPPECVSLALQNPQGYSPAQQDIWAIGMMLALLCSGKKLPWGIACPVSDPDFLAYSMDSSMLRGELGYASDELVDFLRFRVLTVDPSQRASLQEIRDFVEKKALFKKEGLFSKFKLFKS
ncbi:Serine/threonine protein kinase [Stygiomarasmius scandens]|uniref:non-specific serine/threonine protein kinase n=1 Tax=Marasmiellus scandens TaxID=2682957 RepID=A0ABR1K5T6_9AGAR